MRGKAALPAKVTSFAMGVRALLARNRGVAARVRSSAAGVIGVVLESDVGAVLKAGFGAVLQAGVGFGSVLGAAVGAAVGASMGFGADLGLGLPPSIVDEQKNRNTKTLEHTET